MELVLDILPGSTFRGFPTLPTELRLKIWSYALRVQRVIELQYCLIDPMFFTFQHVPALLHTNQESREAALVHYRLSFGTNKNPPSTYFNNIYDIVYFGSHQYSDEVADAIEHFGKAYEHLEPYEKIQTLALAQHLWTPHDYFNPFAVRTRRPKMIRHFHTAFPSLKTLIFVKLKGEPWEDDGHDEAAYQDNSGISLRDSEPDTSLLANPELTLKAVISFFEVEKREFPANKCPDVVVMEYAFDRLQ